MVPIELLTLNYSVDLNSFKILFQHKMVTKVGKGNYIFTIFILGKSDQQCSFIISSEAYPEMHFELNDANGLKKIYLFLRGYRESNNKINVDYFPQSINESICLKSFSKIIQRHLTKHIPYQNIRINHQVLPITDNLYTLYI